MDVYSMIKAAVLRIRPIFSNPDPVHFSDPDQVHFFVSESGCADPVLKIRIRIRVSQKRSDPTGSYFDMFLMFSKINNLYGIFIPNLNIL